MKLLSVGNDAKTRKGQTAGILTGILYLAPSNESSVLNVCPSASAGCRAACLFTAGRGGFKNVRQARIRKTLEFWQNRERFLAQLSDDIRALVAQAQKKGLRPAVRLNGTSDIAWETLRLDGKTLMELHADVQFYDYTKRTARVKDFAAGRFPANYHLTYSRSERGDWLAEAVLRLGGNVAVVFRKLPDTYLGHRVIPGDEHDARFLDPRGVIVGLTAKGRAKQDESGFVV